ncbi:site-specific DNA-methyltransferase [Candidatus Pacearchaeota archaeon]|nr:site-specific DNA-methyltransferase [Candidatus Pacearchaeota archaeon]
MKKINSFYSSYYKIVGNHHQKPIDLITKMILHSSKEGDLILDPFCGSGAVCIACKEMKRKWIGIELEVKWVRVARGRVN